MYEAKNILIVDDEPNLYITLAAILNRAGYNASVAKTAGEAFLYLKNCVYRVIILDLNLKETSGLQLLPMFRRLYPAVPVLILTGDDSTEKHVRAFRLGARGYLLKPIDPQQILSCIELLGKEQEASRYQASRLHTTKWRQPVEDEL